MNKIGVVMATYKMEPMMLRQAILSVVCQSIPDWKLYIVTAPGDDTIDAIRSETAPEPRIEWMEAPKANVYAQRNVGLLKAAEECKYVTMLDSDDFMLPCKFQVELFMIELDHLDVVYSSYYYTDPNLVIFKHQPVPKAMEKEEILGKCWLPDYSMVSAKFMQEKLLVDDPEFGFKGYLNWPRYKTSCVYDFWIRAIENNARLGMHTAPTWLYRQREGSLSRAPEKDSIADRDHVIIDAKKRWGIKDVTKFTSKQLWKKGDHADFG